MRIRNMYLVLILGIAFMNNAFAIDYVIGKIKFVHAGPDTHYGVRFGLDISQDNSNGVCNTQFVYTEPKTGNGHSEMVAVFTAAYMAGKEVNMTVRPGRNGYCELFEGRMQ